MRSSSTGFFSGPHWQYLALEQEIPEAGDYAAT